MKPPRVRSKYYSELDALASEERRRRLSPQKGRNNNIHHGIIRPLGTTLPLSEIWKPTRATLRVNKNMGRAGWNIRALFMLTAIVTQLTAAHILLSLINSWQSF